MTVRESLSEFLGPIAYPATFELGDDSWTVTFVGLSDTDGTPLRAQAPKGTEGAIARGLLQRGLSELIRERLPIVAPRKLDSNSRANSRHQRLVPVKTTLAMKALLWESMRHLSIDEIDLAAMLACSAKEVRRLLDPAMENRDKLSDALDAVGRPVALTLIDPGAPRRLLSVHGDRPNPLVPASAVAAQSSDLVETIKKRSKGDPQARQVLVMLGRSPSDKEAARMRSFRIPPNRAPILVWMSDRIRPRSHASYLRQHIVDPDRRFDLYVRVGDNWVRRGREI